MRNNLKHFITHIQNADEPVRRRWLLILSGSSMLIVIALWIGYINLIVTAPEGPPLTAEATPPATDPGFPKIFGAGLKAVTDEARKQIGGENEITIENPKGNFQLSPEKLPPIPRTKLP
jgi:hypothetical protein